MVRSDNSGRRGTCRLDEYNPPNGVVFLALPFAVLLQEGLTLFFFFFRKNIVFVPKFCKNFGFHL